MNVENYRRFLGATGHRVISSPSGCWFDINRAFYESIPPFRIISPDQQELDALFRQHHMIGLKYCSSHDGVGKRSVIYICQDRSYDLKSVHPKMRNKVRQGLRECTVRPIAFDYLRDQGMPLNLDTLKRQGRDDPLFSQPAGWMRLCRAGQESDGASAWGAFVGDQLAAYMITFVIDGCINILHQMSRTDLLSTHANNALAFVATREMLAASDVQCVSYGQESIRVLPGLVEYKVRLGYQKWPMRYMVILHPLVRPILLSRASDELLSALNQLLPNNDVLKRIKGIVAIAKQSQDAGLSNTVRAGVGRKGG